MEFSEIYSRFDEQEEQNLKFKRDLEANLDSSYLTFYEKLLNKSGLSSLLFSLVFGILLFLLHLGASIIEPDANSKTIIEDFSYFLALLNFTGMYLVFSATEKLKEFLSNLIQLTKIENTKRSIDLFIKIFISDFIGKRTIIFGFLFGIVNSLLAIIFGISYFDNGQYILLTTFLLQVFFIGFLGGITVNGIAVVVRLIKNISIKDDINLSYFYPDQCAGTLVIGNILFLFSVHFIIIGVLIFLFIHNFNWTHEKPGNYYVNAAILFWKVFPFLLSGIIFFLPVRKINEILKEYKLFEQLRIRKRMNYLNNAIMSFEPDKEDSKEKIEILDNHYQKLVHIDHQIEELNTWPYNLRYRATFLSIFLPILIGMVLELSKHLITNLFD